MSAAQQELAGRLRKAKHHPYRVIFQCPACHRQQEVHVYSWDIADVVHDCNGAPAFVVTFKPGARSVF